MNCPKCQQEITDTASFCGACGYKMEQPSQDSSLVRSLPQINEPLAPPLTTGQPTLKKAVSWTMIILWAGAALVGILAESFFRSALKFPYMFVSPDIMDASIIISHLIPFLIQGLFIGCLQWIILKRNIDISANWILLTMIGLVVGNGISWFFMGRFYLVNMGILGFAQFIEMRKHLTRGWSWVIVTVSSAAIILIISRYIPVGDYWWIINSGGIYNFAFHLLSGIGLFYLLRKNVNV